MGMGLLKEKGKHKHKHQWRENGAFQADGVNIKVGDI
jgi:hypothetical protein